MNRSILRSAAITLALVCSCSLASVLAGCSDGGKDVTLDSNGNIRPSEDGSVTELTFWGYGDENETEVFQSLVDDFNEINEGLIKVNYVPQLTDGYSEVSSTALSQTRARVDVLYVGEEMFKRYAEAGYLEPLDDYINSPGSQIKPSEMWDSSLNRYLYDVDTTTQDGPNAHYWGVAKDIGPTVIFYNETYFNNAGVKVLSVAKEDLKAFNEEGAKDARGNTKSELGIQGTVKEHGYFTDESGQKWFNNQIPMSWEECRELAELVQENERTAQNKDNIYGFFTEWWFNYGWSVGGDCIEYVETSDPQYDGGYWDFTLMDDTPNYIVKDEAESFSVNGHTYGPGEIIEWADKLTDPAASEKSIRQEVLNAVGVSLDELPSQRDAFVEFVRIGQKKGVPVDGDLTGYGICPSPTTIGSDSGKTSAFQNQQIAMLVDGRWNVVNFRKVIGDKPNEAGNRFEWDVAPLPMYKEYYEEGDAIPTGKEVGDVKVHGVEAGHSSSIAISINAKSNKKNAAWKFCEYIGGPVGQMKQAEAGFAIPAQKELGLTETFLQTDRNPRNSIAFYRAAAVQTPGDWWYLPDKLWINDWAGVLNSEVRNGKTDLVGFENSPKYLNTWAKLKDYTRA